MRLIPKSTHIISLLNDSCVGWFLHADVSFFIWFSDSLWPNSTAMLDWWINIFPVSNLAGRVLHFVVVVFLLLIQFTFFLVRCMQTIQFVAVIWPIRQHNQSDVNEKKWKTRERERDREEEKRSKNRKSGSNNTTNNKTHRNEIVSTQAMHMLTVFGWIFIRSHSFIYIGDFSRRTPNQMEWTVLWK